MTTLRQPDHLESVSPFTMSLIESLVDGSHARARTREDVEPAVSGGMRVEFLDPASTKLTKSGRQKKERSLSKSILNVLNGNGNNTIERLAFETDPTQHNSYASVYQNKLKLIPDTILKRIAIQDDLVASIVNTRAAQVQSFGRPQPDRFSTGFKVIPDELILDKMSPEEREAVEKRIDRVEQLLVTCGHTKGHHDQERTTFAQYLGMSTRNAVTVGRIATEIIWVDDEISGEKKFHSFRPIDAGTIYRAASCQSEIESVRKEALHLLEQLKNEKLEPERFVNNEFAFVQVINGRPVQGLTESECVVHNFYPVADVELDGYPVTPIDTAIAAVTTHINITTHNRMYFQTGRAARGMVVIQSDDVNEDVVNRIKQQFQASINNVSNSWRMPVFAVGTGDQISWQSIDSGARDMEFQYLSDTNARVIMSAFQISPEELPGYQHLSRGTNNQSLSESNNEYKLEASRDVGIRPLIAQFEDFLNARILPLLDENLAKFCIIKFIGLDSETPEKESVRLQQDMGLHYTYDEILQKVEKKPIGMEMGGQLPLNALYQAKLDAYYTVGEILEKFCGRKGASKDPQLAYRRDPFWFQQIQIQMQQQQMQMQQQQMQQQAQQPQQPGQPGQDPQQGQPEQGQPQQDQSQEASPQGQQGGGDLSTGLDQVIGLLGKSEAQLPPSRRRILEQHKITVDRFAARLDSDIKRALEEIVDLAEDHVPKAKG